MSLLTRPKRLNPSVPSPAVRPIETPRVCHEAEAPERAALDREAPETRVSRHREAPDSGDGRAHYYEHEFTRGRSQS